MQTLFRVTLYEPELRRFFFYLVHQDVAAVDEIGFPVGGKFSLFERIMDCPCHFDRIAAAFLDRSFRRFGSRRFDFVLRGAGCQGNQYGEKKFVHLQLPWLIKVFRCEAVGEAVALYLLQRNKL